MSKRKTKTKAEKKARSAKFKAETISTKNRLIKENKERYEKLVETQSVYRRISIIEHVYKINPKLGVESDGKIIVNTDAVYVKDDILYWTSDDNPIVAGLDSLDNYHHYTIDFINQVFLIIRMREIEKKMVDSENGNDEFELVESNIEEDSAVEVITPEAIK